MKRIAYVNNSDADRSALDVSLLPPDCTIEVIRNARFAVDVFLRKMPDLVVINLPTVGLDSIELLTTIRQHSMIPVIIRAPASNEIDHIIALHYGADDYLPATASRRFLAERIKSILKRHEDLTSKSGPKNAMERVVRIGDLVIDPPRREVRWKDQQVGLTSTEFQMLVALAKNPGHVKSRDQLMSAAYPDEVYLDERTIDSHVKRLRKKFKLIDADFSVIETLYGVGYRFNEQPTGDQARTVDIRRKTDAAVGRAMTHH